MSNGVAIGYGDAESGVRFMPVSPSSGALQGAQAVAGGMKHVSSALMQGSQDMAQLDAIRQKEQQEAFLFNAKANAEMLYSNLMTDGKKGFGNRLDAENFMPEYDEKWNDFYSSTMEGVPAEVRPQMEFELAKIRTAQSISLQGYGAQVARKSKIAGLDALAQVYEGQGRIDEAEQAILARPDLTPDEKFLGIQTMHARFADSRQKAEKAQREGEQARSYEGWFSAVKTQRGAMEFLVKAARPEDRDELIRSVGPAKYDALLKDAQEMADCDGTVAVSDAIRNGKVEDLRKAFEGGSWRADELDIINSIWKNEGRIDEDSWNRIYAAMEWDAVRCPDAPAGSTQMQQYQDAFKRKWSSMGVDDSLIADKLKAMDEVSASVYGKFDPSDAMSSLKGMNYLHPKTNVHRYADGDKPEARRLDGNMIAVQKDDAGKEVAHNERLILEAFNNYRLTDEGKKATKMQQKQKFYDLVTDITGQKMTGEVVQALERQKAQEENMRTAQQGRFSEFNRTDRAPFERREQVPKVQTFDVEDLSVRGAVVPAAVLEAYGDHPLMMEIETPDKKVIRVPVVGSAEGDGIGVTESVAATVKGWEAKVSGGARVSIRPQSVEERARYGDQEVVSGLYARGVVPGMIEQGNIDLTNRPVVKNDDGTISTVRSASFNFDGKEYLLPTVSDDGRILTDDEAVEQFKQTGKHLGVFNDSEHATQYAEKLHRQQEKMYANVPASLRRASAGTPLARYASIFAAAGQKYGVEPELLMAIAMHETGNGTSSAFRRKKNAMGVSDSKGPRSFGSVEESIFYMARQLKRNYLDKGLKDVASIGAKYAPIGAGNDPGGLNAHWVSGVNRNLKAIKG